MTREVTCLHERFQRQVSAAPDAPALTFSGEHLSYAELNARANRLAAYLRARGIGLETPVGLCLNRNFDTVVAILAVLKSGGAYVPMDPLYPAERMRTIVKDAACPLVLVHGEHAGRFSGDGGQQLVVLDGAERPWDDCDPENPANISNPDGLAYIIYTSGSTGKPKGALVTHRNVYRLFTAMQPDFGFHERDVWTLFHSYAFDFSVSEMWGAFFFGGRLVMVPHTVSRSPEAFYQLLIDEQVTVLNQTPSAFKQVQMIDEAAPDATVQRLALRYVLVGGEFMALPSLAPWYARHGDTEPRIVHVYGITETTVFVTYRPLAKSDTAPGTPSLIGKAIADLTVYVLDEERKPVAVGEVGELYIGGPGVCRGYLNRPELTAERFIPDPVGDAGTLYKSGDLVRLLDGDLEFIGRNDAQVQLRGYRIELGEIQAEMAEHPAIRSAVVQLREDLPGEPRLVAYYLAAAPVPAADLREHLGEALPGYMVPSAFVHLDAFPLNNNGKVDMDALPAPAAQRQVATPYVAPRNDIERYLATLWEELLAAPRIGVHDDLLALGGHSLQIMQMLVRVRLACGVDLPLEYVMGRPTIAAHASVISEAGVSAPETSEITISKADRSRAVPLSFAQERLWIIDRLDPGNTVYNIPILFAIQGAVEVSWLRASLDAVVARHEALRTTLGSAGGAPVQVIHEPAAAPFEAVDTFKGRGGDAGAQIAEALSAAARKPFDLENGPLLRLQYYPVAATRSYLGLLVHHTVFDGWSISVFLHDLAESYKAQARGGDAALPPPDRHYADYAVWQRNQNDTPAFAAQLDYWRGALAGPHPVLDLQTDFPRPPTPRWEGHVARTVLAPEMVADLERFSRREGKTLFTVLLASWKTLLYRYTGQEDLIVGSALAGRNRPEFEGLVGFFVNTVALRSQPASKTPFDAFLKEVERGVIGAQQHQDVPFERVVAEVQHERDASRSPLFQVMFVLHNTPRYAASLGSAEITGEEIGNGGAKFDLTLAAQPCGEALHLSLEYDTALFRGASAERILRCYTTLLESIIARPNAPLGDLDILDPAERARVLSIAGPRVSLDGARPLAETFAMHAARNPNAPAVHDGEVSLTYAELDRRANQVARLLLAGGLGREEAVPFYLSRSVWALVAMLGVLKAGGAYVPLDLQDPPARRNRVLATLQPRVILSERGLLDAIETNGVARLCLDDPELLAPFDTTAPPVPAAVEDLAYIIFTSGSTGDPKGVACTQLGVVNLFQDLHERQPVRPGDACSVWAALSFDASVYEIWTALLAGATVHLAPERVRLDPQQCLNWMAARRIKAAYLPGYMMPALCAWQRVHPIPLCRLMVGVEPLREALLGEIVEATPGLALVNAYGPTETAIYVTLYPVAPRTPPATGTAPIGKPIQNTHLYVLDPGMTSVPPGVPGELYVAGAGVSRGYYRDPDLTAESFVANPFSGEWEGRLYRTGDLVYLREDGNLQFVRRIGRYIKLRGLRIDPGEIESILRFHPDIAEAAVDLRKDPRGGDHLVAYVRPSVGRNPDEAGIAEYLAGELPTHMRPGRIVVLGEFPRTVQGKLDRAALPDPPAGAQEREPVQPLTALEEQIAAVWRASLQRSDVGVRNNFFDLGGHSLLAIQVVARINEEFGSVLSVQDFFERPTIEAVAAYLSNESLAAVRAPQSTGGQLLEIKPGTAAPFFCVKGAGDVGGSYDTFAGALNAGQPFFGFPDLDFPGLGKEAGAPTVQTLAACCIREMRRIQPRGPYLIGGYSFGGVVAYEIARQLLEAGETVPLIAILDSGVPGHYEEYKGGAFAPARNRLNRIRVRITVLATCWKMLVGYARDGVRIAARRILRPGDVAPDAPGFRDYFSWVQLDTSVQYFLIHAGLVKPTIRERRLEMLNEQLVMRSTKSMVDAQRATAEYEFKPIPAQITLFRAEHNPWRTEKYDPTLGWSQYAEKGVRVEVVPGNHMVIIRRPYATDLGRALQRVIDDLRADGTDGL